MGTEQDSLSEAEKEEWEELLEKPEADLTDAEKTSKIKLSIKRRFDAPEWALAFELASPSQRRADAIAVNTFPSRNFKIVGFEFKASRSDWLNEKRDGAKSDYFVKLCDEWYVVAWNGAVEEAELPDGWGLLEFKPNSEQLWKQVESDLTDRQQGQPDRPFWGRFLQKTVGGGSNYTHGDLTEARKRGYEEGREDGEEYAKKHGNRRLTKKAEKWDELESAGLDWLYNITDDDIRELKAARNLIKMLDEEGYRSLYGEFEGLESALMQFQSHLANLHRAIESADDAEHPGED